MSMYFWIKKTIKSIVVARRLKKHRAHLSRLCVINGELNGAKWQKKESILNVKIDNLTGNKDRIKIGKYCNLNLRIHCGRRGSVLIGDYFFTNENNFIRCDHSVEIGDYCMFGPNVRIWDTKNHPLSASMRLRQAMEISVDGVDSYEAGGAPIKIGNNVWLCMNVTVLSGVTIGDGSVVAAGSIVTKDIPPMSFAAGIPAKVIGRIPQ